MALWWFPRGQSHSCSGSSPSWALALANWGHICKTKLVASTSRGLPLHLHFLVGFGVCCHDKQGGVAKLRAAEQCCGAWETDPDFALPHLPWEHRMGIACVPPGFGQLSFFTCLKSGESKPQGAVVSGGKRTRGGGGRGEGGRARSGSWQGVAGWPCGEEPQVFVNEAANQLLELPLPLS